MEETEQVNNNRESEQIAIKDILNSSAHDDNSNTITSLCLLANCAKLLKQPFDNSITAIWLLKWNHILRIKGKA